MARKQSHITKEDSPQIVDDFKLIKGIGPTFAARLHEAGIISYRQLAALTPAELALKIDGLSAKQIALQDWTGQARKLASKKTTSKPIKKEAVKGDLHQHYENFTFEFLLDEKHVVRRTHVAHVQSGDADTWAGWDVETLIDFLARHTGVRVTKVKKMNKEDAADRSQVPQNMDMETKTRAFKTPALQTFRYVEPLPSIAGREAAVPVLQSSEIVRVVDPLCLRSLELITNNSDSPVSFLQQDQPYTVRLHLDLAEGVASRDLTLIFKATVIAKQLGGPSHHVGETISTFKYSENIIMEIDGASLPPGAHRLEAFVEMKLDESSSGFTTSLKGNLLQVY